MFVLFFSYMICANILSKVVANLLINVKSRFEKNRGLFIAGKNGHNNNACKSNCFCRLGLRSTAVLREQMSFIHAGHGMNAAISYVFKQSLRSAHLGHPIFLSLWHNRSVRTLRHRQPCKHRNACLHCASYP